MQLNPLYMKPATVVQIRGAFSANAELPSILLQDFFTGSAFQALLDRVEGLAFTKRIDPMHASYDEAEVPSELHDFFLSEPFLQFISEITSRKIAHASLSLRRFSWKDYALLHDEKPAVDVIFDLTTSWTMQMGGSLIYRDLEGESTSFEPLANALVIVDRTDGIDRFVQYVNHYGRSMHRTFLLCSFS